MLWEDAYGTHFVHKYPCFTHIKKIQNYIVEIHRTRGAPLKDYIPDLQKMRLFSSSHASVALRGILQKNIDEASKKNNFQKKFIKKYLFVEEIGHFQEQKSAKFPPNPEIFKWKSTNRFSKNRRFSIFIDFPLKIAGMLGKFHTFCS